MIIETDLIQIPQQILPGKRQIKNEPFYEKKGMLENAISETHHSDIHISELTCNGTVKISN
jgi:hypothetical protein